MLKQTYYEFFSLKNFEEDPKVIKKAYRTMALKHHPDRNTNKLEAEKMMKHVNEVYRILSQHKEQYDMHLRRKSFSSAHTEDAFRYSDEKAKGSEWKTHWFDAGSMEEELMRDFQEATMTGNWKQYYQASPKSAPDRGYLDQRIKELLKDLNRTELEMVEGYIQWVKKSQKGFY